jgi:upstream activation factor subunit UAF30
MATTTASTITFDDLMKELKAIRKDIRKIKAHIDDPTGEKKVSRSQNNGFNKPLQVTPKLREFLKLPADEMISRSQVTRRINDYVTEKGLKAGQNISLDATLKDLLNPPEGTQVTFLNIQKFINPHYIKEEKPKEEKKAAPAPAAEKPAAAAEEKPVVKKPTVKKPAAAKA